MEIGAIVSLDEMGLDDEALSKNGFVYLHIPVEDYSTPTLQGVWPTIWSRRRP